jgi:6-pyruvoyltetrahydropterin/6-carboxytetrahydropterin synthase
MVRERTGMSIMDAREVTNPLDEVGRVIDFSVVKAKLCQWLEDNWDHKMLLWDRDAIFPTLEASDVQPGLVAVSFNPTAENMARYLVETVGPKQLHGTNVQLVMVEVEETRKCSATYWRKR